VYRVWCLAFMNLKLSRSMSDSGLSGSDFRGLGCAYLEDEVGFRV
jgi:hypothetical protein